MVMLVFEDVSPLNTALLGLAIQAEAALPTLPEKADQALQCARCAAIRQGAGDPAGAAAGCSRARALLAGLTPKETADLDQAKLAIAFTKAGDSAAADTAFDVLRTSAKAASDPHERLTRLLALADTYHAAGNDVRARSLLRQLLPEIKQVEGLGSDVFGATLYNLATYGDPDLAEAQIPLHKNAVTRSVALRAVALARRKTQLARARTTLQRAVAMTLAANSKTIATVEGHITALVRLGQPTEAEALIERLPRLFPAGADAAALAQVRVTSYGAVGKFPKALALLDKLPGNDARAKLTDLLDQAIDQKNFVVAEQLIQRIQSEAARDPELKKDPTLAAGVTLFLHTITLLSLVRQERFARAGQALKKLAEEIERIPGKEAVARASMPLGLAELILQFRADKG